MVHGLGSGVERVVGDYVAATPEAEHHVLHSTDPSCHGASWAGSAGFSSVREVPGSPWRFAREVRRARRDLSPDIVHAHSSVAGALVRTLLPRAHVVYTPHCFAFVRRDVRTTTRAAFWLVEALLGRRTAALAACSAHEAALGRRLIRPHRVHYVPNIASLAPAPARVVDEDPRPSVVAMGRIAPQKAPESFAALAEDLRGRADVRLTWIGAGSAEQTAALRAAGVEVTGWLDHDAATARLAAADLYVHTARWEATPLTVLEAARLEVPVLARDTAPMRALDLRGTWSGRAQLADAVVAALPDGDVATAAGLRADGRRLSDAHSPQRQREALRACYASVLPAWGDVRTTEPPHVNSETQKVSA
ncbi:glycosyl transferase [Marmoricola endophyticus]|uniref:Glycosyl transferase n=1 Tax=Marmoricola endophyticus TaxID=2040280 RepID=A0A917F313_9ACTN|nr:glycosyl transferase [Marmoricola endophyticus]